MLIFQHKALVSASGKTRFAAESQKVTEDLRRKYVELSSCYATAALKRSRFFVARYFMHV